MSGGAEKVVCVTGASGYIASWLVKLLLQRGYTVNASVRDPNDPKKTEHLLMLDGAKERLHLFKADLLEEGSFDSLFDGCEGVFHIASPVDFSANNPQAELIEPAVEGTLNVLRSCAKVSSVKRVVLTSSMAAVVYSGKPLTPDVVVDETWISDPAVCEKSKTLAEKAAWEFSKENGIDMVAMLPGWVSGPLLQPTLNATLEPLLKLVKGAESVPLIYPAWVDVRDVANAHILAFENPSASGRYCLVERVLQFSEFVKLMRELFPDINLPEKCGDDHPFASSYKVSRERAESLGLKFTPVEVTLKDTFESLRARNLF
ncbi:phenylacetaldehyde reductase-like isoform X2 [Carya illinoinensis]|uniref:phenylacetaldehyde reductase-like isoform X2 n=1 Tax=Carya illinoinensis TaxID=32201 RepID=UPI001C71A057|nr:phenylacetaldehyde reductase-like isoform X2 [Carya illinoinensis]